jgi:hypothetical protein
MSPDDVCRLCNRPRREHAAGTDWGGGPLHGCPGRSIMDAARPGDFKPKPAAETKGK